MGGKAKSKSKPKTQSAPPQAKPIDYGKIMSQANKQAKTQYQDQLNAQIAAYPRLEALQLGTIRKVSDNLSANNNAYTQRATNQLIAAEDQATQIGNIAADTERLSAQATQDLQGTDLESELQRQATSDLALGRSLNPEQERAATQQARAGMSARGLGTGTGALAAEVLNRDAYASAREAERRNFAGSTNQMLVGKGVTPSYSHACLFPIQGNLVLLMANHEYGFNATDASQVTGATLRAKGEIHQVVHGLRKLGGPWDGV
jgi:hypothetical protein